MKMGARVNLWVLVFATILLSTTWYISTLPMRIYASSSEPSPLTVRIPDTEGAESPDPWDPIPPDGWEIAYHTDNILDYDEREIRNFAWPSPTNVGTGYAQVHAYSSTMRTKDLTVQPNIGQYEMDYLHTADNLSLGYDGEYVVINLAIDTMHCYENQISLFTIRFMLYSGSDPNVHIKLYAVSEVEEYELASSDTLSVSATSYVEVNLTVDYDDYVSALGISGTSYNRLTLVVKDEGPQYNLDDTHGYYCEVIAYKPDDGGVYETEGGETITVMPEPFTPLNILKICTGLVGAMCILAAAASTPLWNPTKAWGRRRGRR